MIVIDIFMYFFLGTIQIKTKKSSNVKNKIFRKPIGLECRDDPRLLYQIALAHYKSILVVFLFYRFLNQTFLQPFFYLPTVIVLNIYAQ